MLEIENARTDLNLVTLCSRCHERMEGRKYKIQFAEIGEIDIAAMLELLEEGRCNPAYMADELDKSQEYIRERLRELKRIGLVKKVYRGLYEIGDDDGES